VLTGCKHAPHHSTTQPHVPDARKPLCRAKSRSPRHPTTQSGQACKQGVSGSSPLSGSEEVPVSRAKRRKDAGRSSRSSHRLECRSACPARPLPGRRARHARREALEQARPRISVYAMNPARSAYATAAARSETPNFL
jgi:hypothetical protein